MPCCRDIAGRSVRLVNSGAGRASEIPSNGCAVLLMTNALIRLSAPQPTAKVTAVIIKMKYCHYDLMMIVAKDRHRP